MDLDDISNFLGGSILFDDYQLDVQDVEERIGTFDPTVSTEGYIKFALLQGLLTAAKGEFEASETLFMIGLVMAQSTGDTRLISRCETYQFLLFTIKGELSLTNFYDDTDGDWRRMSDAEAGATERRHQFIRDRSTVWSSLGELDRFEREMISSFAEYSSKLRLYAFPHHPAYQNNMLEFLFESSIPFPPPMPEEAEHLGLKATSRHLRRLNAQYLLAGGSEQGTQELEQLYQECLNDGDLVGAASCQLILGDNRLSFPFTSPVVLNMALMNGISSRLTDWHDSLETGYPLMSDSEADQFYQRAFELFGAAGSIRGTAAVHLRRGCVALAEYLNALSLGPDLITPLPGIGTWRVLAESELDYAFDLYQGGGGMERLVSGHRIILKILVSCSPSTFQHPAGEADDTVSDAANIGTWAKDNANMGVARLTGLLLLGVGRRLSTAPHHLDAASLCCACARSCFRAAEERILELHATIQQAKLHHSHGVMDLARSYLDAGQSVLIDAIDNQIDPLIQTTPSVEDRRTLKVIRTNRITEFDSAAASIYANNPRANGWGTLRRRLLPEEDGSMVTGLFNSVIDNLTNLNNTSATGAILGAGNGATTGASIAESAEAQPAQPEADESNEPLSMASLLKQFVGDSMNDISRIRQQFQKAIADRRKVLVVHNDWQKGQEYLQGVLQSLDRPGLVKSSELYITRATVLHYLGRHGEIRQWLPDAIPTMFGGRMPTACDNFHETVAAGSPDLEAMNQNLLREHGERSLFFCFIAQDWELGAEVLSNIREHHSQLLDKLYTDRSDSSWITMVYIAAIEEHSGHLESSFSWFIKALDVVETSRSRLTDVADRRELLNIIHSAELFAGLARLSLRFPASQDTEEFGRLTEHWAFHGPTWEDEALLFLEQGRARALLDLLTPEGMSEDFLDWSYRLRTEELEMRAGNTTVAGGGGDGDLAGYLAKIRSDLREGIESPSRAMILARLHRPHFAADARSLYESIPDDAIVVHMNPSRDGVLMLYVSRKGVELARPSHFTDQRMEKQVLHYLKLFKNVDIYNLPPKTEYQGLLEELSDEIIGPARHLIHDKSHLIFVPSQSWNKFPFSALLLNGEPLFLLKDVSVVPSLSVLRQLVQMAHKRIKDHATIRAAVIYKAPVKNDRAFSSTSRPPQASRLPFGSAAGRRRHTRSASRRLDRGTRRQTSS